MSTLARSRICASSCGVCITEGTHMVYVSQELAEMLGYDTPEETLKATHHKVFFLLSASARSTVMKAIQKPASTYEIDVVKKDGSPLRLRIWGRAIPSLGPGKRIGVVCPTAKAGDANLNWLIASVLTRPEQQVMLV